MWILIHFIASSFALSFSLLQSSLSLKNPDALLIGHYIRTFETLSTEKQILREKKTLETM